MNGVKVGTVNIFLAQMYAKCTKLYCKDPVVVDKKLAVCVFSQQQNGSPEVALEPACKAEQ